MRSSKNLSLRNINFQILNTPQINIMNDLVEKPMKSFSIKELSEINLDSEKDVMLLKQEIKIRMSKIIRQLPNYFNSRIRDERSYKFIEDYYHMNLKELLERNDLQIFGHIETRLGGTTEMLSDAILNSSVLDNNDNTAMIEKGLKEMFAKTLSVEILVSLLHGLQRRKPYLRQKVDMQENINTAYDNARYLCEQHYLSAPEIEINGNAEMCYFPSHLYVTFFELLKNSLRASVEYHGEDCENIPNIKAEVCSDDEWIIIKLIDAGGGYHNGDVSDLFKFFKSSAIINSMSLYQGAHSSPMAGYGFGLGIVKIYMEYFGGSINLYNLNEGLCAELKFYKDPAKARENLIGI